MKKLREAQASHGKLRGPTQRLKIAKILGFRVQNGREIDVWAVLSLSVGRLRLKRLQKDQASHGIALDTPHAYILKKKNWPKTGPPNLGFGVRNGPKMVKNDPNAYNLHEVKLFDQLLPTFH